MRNSLHFFESILVISLLFLLGSLFLIAKIGVARSSSTLSKTQLSAHQSHPVKILGAVKRPGVYPAFPGTPLKKIVAKSFPLPLANLKKIDLNAPVEGPLEIYLEVLEEISVRVEGAVSSPLSLTLPIGAKVSDLRSKITLDPDADETFFKSRRRLKENEILIIPKKRG